MTDGATETCAECGGSGRFGGCARLFDTLLALDHQRMQPWATFHGLNVACYLLQHPSRTGHRRHAEHLDLVDSFLEGGVAALGRLERERVLLNRQHRLCTSERPVVPRTDRPGFTIVEVSVDGTFPADGYEARMTRWARSVQ